MILISILTDHVKGPLNLLHELKLVIDTVNTFSAHLILLCDFELQLSAHPADFELDLSLSKHALRK